MRINFYDVMLTDTGRTMLVKDKAVNYDAGKMNTPENVVLIMRDLFFLSKGTVNASLVTPREVFIRAGGTVHLLPQSSIWRRDTQQPGCNSN